MSSAVALGLGSNRPRALEAIADRDPTALMFGTDLPLRSRHAAVRPAEIDLPRQALQHDLARRALSDNARAL